MILFIHMAHVSVTDQRNYQGFFLSAGNHGFNYNVESPQARSVLAKSCILYQTEKKSSSKINGPKITPMNHT